MIEICHEAIEVDEESSGDGDKGDFDGFSGGAEVFVKRFENVIEAGGGEGSHVKATADRGASAVDEAFL